MERFFVNNDIKFLNIEWTSPYPLQISKTVLDCVPLLIFKTPISVISCSFVHEQVPKL